MQDNTKSKYGKALKKKSDKSLLSDWKIIENIIEIDCLNMLSLKCFR